MQKFGDSESEVTFVVSSQTAEIFMKMCFSIKDNTENYIDGVSASMMFRANIIQFLNLHIFTSKSLMSTSIFPNKQRDSYCSYTRDNSKWYFIKHQSVP